MLNIWFNQGHMYVYITTFLPCSLSFSFCKLSQRMEHTALSPNSFHKARIPLHQNHPRTKKKIKGKGQPNVPISGNKIHPRVLQNGCINWHNHF